MKEPMNFIRNAVFQKQKDVYMVHIERIDGKVFRTQDVMEAWGVKMASKKHDVNCLGMGLKRHKEEAFLLYEKAKQNLNLSEYKVTMVHLKEDGEIIRVKKSLIVIDVVLVMVISCLLVVYPMPWKVFIQLFAIEIILMLLYILGYQAERDRFERHRKEINESKKDDENVHMDEKQTER